MNLAALAAGQELEPRRFGPVGADRMKLMAALLRDPNPIHFDVESVRKVGLGDRLVTQGPMTLSFLANLVTDWAGGPQTLRSLNVRYLGNVFVGDEVECRATISAVEPDPGLVALDVEARVGDRPVLQGSAVVSPL